MLITSAEITHAIKANTDAFMAFSEIAISCIEQLTTLNLNATRHSLEVSATVTASMLESNGSMPSSKAKKATSIAASEGTADYFRYVRDIATEAQEKITELMSSYSALQGNGTSLQTAWLKGFDAFHGFGQQFSALTEANRKAMSDVTSRVVNQANVHSRKSA